MVAGRSCCALRALRPASGETTYGGATSPEPRPCTTGAASAAAPRTTMLRTSAPMGSTGLATAEGEAVAEEEAAAAVEAGAGRGALRSSTVELAASERASRACVGLVTLLASEPSGGRSKRPAANMAVRMRAALALSSCRLSDPSCRPSPRPRRLKCKGSGISWSRPPTADATAECVATQSDMTQPPKPSVPLRSATRVWWSAHAAVPLILLYAHMTEPTPARTAASNGGMYTSHRVRSVASSLTGAPILNGPKSGEPRSYS
eukprot:scaffold8656_cov69-Phaeocystis_antarctica.AAC.11